MKGVSKGKRHVQFIAPGAVGDTAGLSCKCGFGSQATADPAGVITLAVSAHGGFFVAALTGGTGVLMGAFMLSCGVEACATSCSGLSLGTPSPDAPSLGIRSTAVAEEHRC